MSSIYRYKALESATEIRIIHLKPGQGDLECSIEHVQLFEKKQYTALSYVWGIEDQPFQMHVDCDQVIPLTTSLFNLFTDLRNCDGIAEKTFWVDQISINQGDKDEKDKQISLMNDIYKNASEVIIYTGPKNPGDNEGLELAVKLLDVFGGTFEIAMARPEDPDTLIAAIAPKNDLSWGSLWPLGDREWAERVWIVQEAVVNNNLRLAYGSELIPWDALALCIFLLSGSYLAAMAAFAGLDNWKDQKQRIQRHNNIFHLAQWRSKHNPASLPPLLDVLVSTERFKSTNAKDKIYSVLGLAGDVKQLGIKVDASRKCPEVFHDVAQRILIASGSLDILSYKRGSAPELPSWVPNWDAGSSLESTDPYYLAYNASAGLKAPFGFEDDDQVLVVSGIFVDEIVYDSGPQAYEVSAGLEPSLKRLKSSNFWANMGALRKHLDVPSDHHQLETPDTREYKLVQQASAVGRALIENRWIGEPLPSSPGSSAIWGVMAFALFLLSVSLDGEEGLLDSDHAFSDLYSVLSSQLPLTPAQMSSLARAYGTNMSHSMSKHICATKARLLCTSQSPTLPGDKIAVLLGGKKCYILRPSSNSNGSEHYELVSDAWVDGYMNGEALNREASQQTFQTIRIR